MNRIITNVSDIQRIKSDRHPDIFKLPEHWQDETYHLDPHKDYTVRDTVSFGGTSIFGAKNMLIEVMRASGEGMHMGLRGNMHHASVENVGSGKNNIRIAQIGVCEHTLAALLGIGLHADFNLSEDNFPNFDEGIAKMLKEIRPSLIEKGASDFITVKEPMAVKFSNGGYFVVEPDEGEYKLIIDHQLSHKKNNLGTQRIRIEMTPERFAHIAAARPPAYGITTAGMKILHKLGLEKFPGLGLHFGNVVFVDKDKTLNANPEFDFNGINREVILHEVVDKMGALGILSGRFVGKITTYRTNHEKDIAAVKIISNNLVKDS